MFMEERNGENESKRTVRAAGTQGRRGSRRGSARTTDGKWQLAAGLLATACGPEESGTRAAAAGSEQPAPALLSATRPSCRLPVTGRGPRAPRSRLARFLCPPPPARLPENLDARRTTCGPLLIHQAPSSRAPPRFRSRAPRPGSGPGLRCWNPRPRVERRTHRAAAGSTPGAP